MAHRFLFDDELTAGSVVPLSEGESSHALQVLRVRPGENVELFDGRGCVAAARIARCTRRIANVEVLDVKHHRRSGRTIAVAAAVPKGERLRWMIEKLTEIGVDRFIPLETERSVVIPGIGKLNRMRNTVVAATRQCGRPWFMEITELQPLQSCLLGALRDSQTVAMGQPGGTSILEYVPANASGIVLAIGPEGGWTEPELAAGRGASATLVELGRYVLRIETAAVAGAAALSLQR